jgi:poly-gamma-glutamate capsule biosynthesis protein CapA/YwtB (metallophosphatase superfamily)
MNPLPLTLLVTLLAAPASAAGEGSQAAAAAPLRVAVVGQALVKQDLRVAAPVAVAQAREYLAGADVAFTNLEVAVAPATVPVTKLNPNVTHVTPDTLEGLREMGFNLLALANNHAWDLGEAGLYTTIEESLRAGFTIAGTGRNLAEAAAPGYLETPNGRVALIAVASGAIQLEDSSAWAGTDTPGVNYLALRADGTPDPEQMAHILARVRESAAHADLVIVYHHNHFWGARRGPDTPPGRDARIDRFATPAWQEAFARELIDHGAGAFVGHGNPALHGVEVYRDRPILYGLGNYIFHAVANPDRYGPTAYQSVVAQLEFRDGRVTGMSFRPLVLSLVQTEEIRRGVPYLARTGEARAILLYLQDQAAHYGTRIEIEGESARWVP